MHSKTLTATLLFICLAIHANATPELGRITVTDSTPNPDAITEDEMNRMGWHNASEALSLLPGILSTSIGSRAESTLFLRGFSIRHTPILIDGIPVSAPFDGYLDLTRFRTASLAGIQVIKAGDDLTGIPGSLAGAVNLYTRLPKKPLEMIIGTEGAFSRSAAPQAIQGWVQTAAVMGKWYAMLSLDGMHSGETTLPDGFTPAGGEDGGKRNNSSASTGEASIRLGYRPDPGQEYALFFSTTTSEKDIPLYAGTNDKVRYWRYPDWSRTRIAFFSKTSGKNIILKGRTWFDGYANTLKSFDSAAFTTQTNNSSFTSLYDDASIGASLHLSTMPLPGLACSADIFFKLDLHKEHNEGEPAREFRDTLFRGGVGAVITLGRTTRLELGAQASRLAVQRADHYTNSTIIPFETSDSSGLDLRTAFLFLPEKRHRFRLSLTRRTRLPSMKERYSYRLGRALPNPDLQAETALHLELSWRFVPAKGLSFSTALFHSRTDDYILDLTISPGLTQNQNIGEVRFTGMEATADAVIVTGLLRLRGGYTLLSPHTGSSTPRLIGIAEHTLFLQAVCTPLPQLSTILTGRYVSTIQSASDGSRPAGERLHADLNLEWRPLPTLRIQMSVRNIFDSVIEYEEGYPAPGREYRLGAEFRM